MNNIKQGSIIKGPNWPEPVEIKLIEEAGDYIHIVGATKNSRQHVDDLIPRAEFSQLKVHYSFFSFSYCLPSFLSFTWGQYFAQWPASFQHKDNFVLTNPDARRTYC